MEPAHVDATEVEAGLVMDGDLWQDPAFHLQGAALWYGHLAQRVESIAYPLQGAGSYLHLPSCHFQIIGFVAQVCCTPAGIYHLGPYFSIPFLQMLLGPGKGSFVGTSHRYLLEGLIGA